ncbi:MAG: dihydrofolate reductase [Candidatus Diapherotrites archaeon]|uniref:Dihydrofolate reductase n=1 Tax=Candidatus Iainarchaeum sp. TaxID=3101447 RepID=A0A7J4KVV2_9ARCH|nr:MAG: dihydrofolate reductase family protein, dihydrofolate reductase [archaeon GW2011_AR21]MBS3058247.1 dihydrofolate reductase [Candidatus Diapherotrites archaeon]HIH21916.1 dihydrofolate reductase [Candidatus Diapherotrites archaeon]HIH33380.1 dihydrofolate reductase [Candidatus Diapherotrites archaeon]
MKAILYMAPTLNGFIAKLGDDTGFVSKNSWKSYRQMIKKAKCMIVGSRTYKIMIEAEDLKGLEKTVVVAVSKKPFKALPKNHFVAKSPKQALQILKRQGFKSALVAGGGALNASFLKEGLIDEIFLDVEPLVLGNGIRLFAEGNFEAKLKLAGVKKLSRNEVQLHYKVLKK